MADILLTTLNAKYIHAAFGLRYLRANLGPLLPRSALVEFDIHQRPIDIVEALLSHQPRVVGVGVYIWNVSPATEVVAILKRLRPEIRVVLGGPEVSHELEEQPIVRLADHVITGEADLAFAELCQQLLQPGSPGRPPKIIAAEPPPMDRVALPYDLYTDSDVAHRVVYVEASRGCPFHCEFCLSSLDVPVRQVPLEPLLEALGRLLARGVSHFKFVDRTFNLNLRVCRGLLSFFLERHRPGLFLHFEMIPDRLPAELRDLLARFPPGSLQLEIGIQSFNETVCDLISRRQDTARVEENFRFLRQETGAHLHADLIVGLPGESLESFAAGFDRLIALRPHEIQVGLLKRLRGTPIARHDDTWGMIYNPDPPYEILQNRLLGFGDLQRMRRFARYWDLVGNSGNFIETAPLLWAKAGSPFQAFLDWSDWLYGRIGRTDQIALLRLAELLFGYLTAELGLDRTATAKALLRDYQRPNRRDVPVFLREALPAEERPAIDVPSVFIPKRQARHSRRPEPSRDSEAP